MVRSSVEISAVTTQYWITGASGDWSDAADWESGAVPGSTDDAVIASNGNTAPRM